MLKKEIVSCVDLSDTITINVVTFMPELRNRYRMNVEIARGREINNTKKKNKVKIIKLIKVSKIKRVKICIFLMKMARDTTFLWQTKINKGKI